MLIKGTNKDPSYLKTGEKMMVLVLGVMIWIERSQLRWFVKAQENVFSSVC